MTKIITEGLTQRELDEMRAAQESFQDSKITIRRREFFPPDDYDHRTTAAEHVSARIHAGFGAFRNVADRFQGITPYTVTVPWDTDIREDDILIDEDNGSILHVRDIRKGNTYQTAIQVLTEQVTDG